MDQLLTVTQWGQKVEVTTAPESQRLNTWQALMLQRWLALQSKRVTSNSDRQVICSLHSSRDWVLGWLSQNNMFGCYCVHH